MLLNSWPYLFFSLLEKGNHSFFCLVYFPKISASPKIWCPSSVTSLLSHSEAFNTPAFTIVCLLVFFFPWIFFFIWNSSGLFISPLQTPGSVGSFFIVNLEIRLLLQVWALGTNHERTFIPFPHLWTSETKHYWIIPYKRVQLKVVISAQSSLGFVLIRLLLLRKNASNCESSKQKKFVYLWVCSLRSRQAGVHVYNSQWGSCDLIICGEGTSRSIKKSQEAELTALHHPPKQGPFDLKTSH